MAVRVRKMQREDLEAVERILGYWNMAPLPRSDARPNPECAEISVENGFVAVAAGRIVGAATYVLRGDGCAETVGLVVDPAWRGKGIGALLQGARLAEMRSKGIRKVRTEADRPETIEWYVSKFGYRVIGKAPKKHAFSLQGVEEWTILELELDRL